MTSAIWVSRVFHTQCRSGSVIVNVALRLFLTLRSGRPEEQDDSENSTIYITGLTEKANLEEMAEFFKHVGPIRVWTARLSYTSM